MNQSFRSLARIACVALAALSISGCPEDEPGEEDAGYMPFADVRCPDDLPELRIGMVAEGVNGAIQAELTDAEDVPAKRFLNYWKIQLQKPDGTPVTDATLTVKSYMRVHDHYGAPPTITPLDNGRFDLAGINMFMRGPWEVQVAVESESEGVDDLVFDVCIE